MTPTRTQAGPRLTGVPQEAADELRVLYQTVYRLEGRIRALEKAGYLTMRQAEERYSPAVMAQALSATGQAPLTVVTVSGKPIIQAQPTGGRKA